jgi:predicted NBD/HSP70 family sugar kinase
MAVKRESVFTYHLVQDRERRNLAILELIRKKGPISRADISKILGVNIVTISNYIDFYIDKKIILEMGFDVSSGGRRPELLELNAKSAYIIGVDISPDTITAIVADLKVNVIARASQARTVASMEDLTAEVIAAIEVVIGKSKIELSRIKNIGIGISGIVDYPSATIHDTDPTRGRTKTSFLKFGKAIEEQFNMPVYIGNDASCAAFAEKTLNPIADVNNLLYVYSDVGLGMVIQGDVYCGTSGCAGEIQLAFNGLQSDEKNFIPEFRYLRPWGPDLGVVRAAQKAIAAGATTEMLALAGGSSEKITKAIVAEAAKKRDKIAMEAVNNAGKDLGVRIAFLVNLFNPEIVIVGGGLEKAGDILFDPIKEAVKRFAFEEPAGSVKISPTMLGDDSVVLGSAALAAREVFIKA